MNLSLVFSGLSCSLTPPFSFSVLSSFPSRFLCFLSFHPFLFMNLSVFCVCSLCFPSWIPVSLCVSFSSLLFVLFLLSACLHFRDFSTFQSLYLWLMPPLTLFTHFVCPFLLPSMQFLPAMLTSLYCAVGMLYCWMHLYHCFQRHRTFVRLHMDVVNEPPAWHDKGSYSRLSQSASPPVSNSDPSHHDHTQ